MNIANRYFGFIRVPLSLFSELIYTVVPPSQSSVMSILFSPSPIWMYAFRLVDHQPLPLVI